MYAWNPRQKWQKKIDCARRWFHRANMAGQYRLSATRLWERVVREALALEINPEKYVGLFKVRARVPERRQRRRQRVRRPDIGHQQCETAGDATDRRGWVYIRLSNLRLAPPTAIRSIAELFVFRVKSIISPREGKKRKKIDLVPDLIWHLSCVKCVFWQANQNDDFDVSAHIFYLFFSFSIIHTSLLLDFILSVYSTCQYWYTLSNCQS